MRVEQSGAEGVCVLGSEITAIIGDALATQALWKKDEDARSDKSEP